MMLRRRVDLLLATVVAVALLAALPSFAIGRDLSSPRIATPDYHLESAAAGATEKGFLLQWTAWNSWDSARRGYGTNADAAGVPRVPALIANSAGDTAIVTSEFNTVWLIERARFYFASELPAPRRRAAP